MNPAIDRSSTRFSSAIAFGAAFVATATSALVTPVALAAAGPGAIGVFVGVGRGSRLILGFGVLGVLIGTMLAGLVGAPPLTILVSATAGVLCWDYASTAISLGDQLGRGADTERLEFVHALLSLGVGLLTIVLSYGIFRSISGQRPVAAVFFLLLTVLLLARTLR